MGLEAQRARREAQTMKSATSWQVLLRIVLLATSYVIAGRLALLLAIPPGFATAIFPPVGIGLAAVLLWGNAMLGGVLLGSTILNLSIAFSAGAQLSITSFSIAFGIAIGSTIHNATASALIRKYIGFPSALNNERQVIGFLLVGAPLASLISATWGVSVLYFAGAVSTGEYAFSWWTWWVGDGIGVLIAAPLVLILFASPRDLWASRRNTVGLPLLVGTAVMVVTFIRASRLEQDGIAGRFNERAQLTTAEIKSDLETCADIVLLAERFMTVAPQSGQSDFTDFSSEIRAAHPELQAMSWIQRVRKDEREAHERAMNANGSSGYTIRERNAANEVVKASERDEYMVVTFVEPLEGNGNALGYDLSSEKIRHSSIVQARDNDEFVVTPPIDLIQGGSGPRLLLIQPVYSGPAKIQVERRNNLRGVISAVINLKPLVQAALTEYSNGDYRIFIDDVTDASHVLPVFASASESAPIKNTAIQFHETWSFGSRTLALSVLPTTSFMQKNRSLQSWVVLAGGLALCGLLGAFLLIVSGRTNHIEGLVKQRTLELSAILDNANEAIMTFNADGFIERANPAASELFGYPLANLLEKRIPDLIPQFDWNAKLRQDHPLEVHGYRQDGTALTLEMTSSQMEVHGRQLFTVMMHDISARKNAERLKDEFVSTVSHELRTPLTSISGSLGLISGGVVGDVSPDVRELVEIARANSNRLTLLVNDLLDIEKMISGKLDVSCHRWDLRDIVRQSLVQIRGYAEQHRITVTIDENHFSAKPAIVFADASRLLQVLANLLSNAIKFSPQDGQVDVSLETTNTHVKVTVRDHGRGVPADFRARIFEKFAQADGADSRARGGTGLGLSISKAIIERFGGKIGFDDAEGGGSSFYFELPLSPSPQGQAPQS
jgi:PAS domain S-box-containing protein